MTQIMCYIISVHFLMGKSKSKAQCTIIRAVQLI